MKTCNLLGFLVNSETRHRLKTCKQISPDRDVALDDSWLSTAFLFLVLWGFLVNSETRHRLKTCNQISDTLWVALSGESYM